MVVRVLVIPNHVINASFFAADSKTEFTKMMNAVRDYILRMQDWKLFPVITGAYCIGQLACMIVISQHQEILSTRWLWSVLMISLGMLPFLTWLWSMGSFFTSVTKPELKLPSEFFNFAIIYPVFYSIFFIAKIQSSALWTIPLHLVAMFCVFYVLRFVSKSLVLAETNKPASFYQYSGPFFLLWFFPIGIWFVQPRVNRLYEERLDQAGLVSE